MAAITRQKIVMAIITSIKVKPAPENDE
jgi:hypothetical protein